MLPIPPGAAPPVRPPERLIPTRRNVGIPDNPPRYAFPPHIGPSIALRPFLTVRPVLRPLDEMFALLFCRQLPRPTTPYLLLRMLKRLKRYPREMRENLQRYGESTARIHHRSKLAQARDLLLLQLCTEDGIESYYEARLARHRGSRDLLAYLPYFEFIWTSIHLQRDLFGAPPFFLNDKQAFGHWARAHGVRTPREFAVHADSPSDLTAQLTALSDEIVIKPSTLLRGDDIEVWQQRSAGSWCRGAERLDPSGLTQRLHRLARSHDGLVLVQERIKNHPDLIPLCGQTLSTCRIVTLINEQGEPEPVELRWRMAIRPETVTDNFATGGVCWHCDSFETGHLACGDQPDLEITAARLDHHPVTGQPMVGNHYPFAREVIAFALFIHRKMPGVLMAGWDIAMSPTGPVALEINFPAGATARIQTPWHGFENTRYGRLLAHHARRWLTIMAPTPPTL